MTFICMYDSLIVASVQITLLGTIISGLVGVAEGRTGKRMVAPWLLSVVLAIGAVGAGLFLLGTKQAPLVIASLPWFFHVTFIMGHLSALFFFIVCAVGCMASLYGARYLAHHAKIYHIPSMHLLLMLFVLGMQGVLLAHTTLGFFLFWELMSLASFFLVFADRTADSIRAALLYLIMTHLGAMAILAGFLIVGHGSLYTELSQMSSAVASLTPLQTGLVFILFLFGFGSKAGLVPMHVWLPEAHPQAPSHISALMSGVMLKIAVYGFLVIAFPIAYFLDWGPYVVLVLGMLSAVYGVLYAAHEKDIKRVLAYSSIENMGLVFMMLGAAQAFVRMQDVGIGSAALAHAGFFMFAFALFHCVNHAFFKSGLFMSAGTIMSAVHSRSLEVMGGLAKRMPFFAGILLCLILAAAALPPFGTFYGEWGFLQSLLSVLRAPNVPFFGNVLAVVNIAVVALVGGLAVFAMIKLFGIAMLGAPRSTAAQHASEPDALTATPIVCMAVVSLAIGVIAPWVLQIVVREMPMPDLTAPLYAARASLPSLWVSVAAIAVGLFVFFLRRILSRVKNERVYQTWDCGQPITPDMEYTATAFASPIRFFFRLILRTRKSIVTSVPVVASNPWIATRTFSITLRSVWYERLYAPIARFFYRISQFVRRLQSGRVQLYLLLMLLTLFVTLIVAL